MGQATDPLGRPADVSPVDYRFAPGHAEHDDQYEAVTREIEYDIEQTRAEMSETINAIQERLSPQHLAEQAREAVYDATIGTAKGVGSNMIETIKRNPIPAAIAALSIGWLVRKSGQQQNAYQQPYRTVRYQPYRQGYDQGYDGSYYGSRYQPASAYYDEAEPGLGERIGDAAGQVRDQAQEMAGGMRDQAQEMAGQVRSQMRHIRHEARDQVEYYGEQAREQFEEAGDWIQQTMRERPMLLGAVAFAVGTAVGMSLPNTPVENRVMGDARDSLLEKVQETAQETFEKVQHVAQEATQAVQETVKLEAREQGLS